jgi:hypothetical protein
MTILKLIVQMYSRRTLEMVEVENNLTPPITHNPCSIFSIPRSECETVALIRQLVNLWRELKINGDT